MVNAERGVHMAQDMRAVLRGNVVGSGVRSVIDLQAHGRATTRRTPTTSAAPPAATIADSRIGLPARGVSTFVPPLPSARQHKTAHRARGKESFHALVP